MSIPAPAPRRSQPSSRTGSHDRRALVLAALLAAQAHLDQAHERLDEMRDTMPERRPLPPEHTEQ